MRRCGPKKFVWYVEVGDYECYWPIAFFDSEEKAKAKLAAYRLNDRNFEQSVQVVKAEVF